MPEYLCCVCRKPSDTVVNNDGFRVVACAEHLHVTWESWRAERARTHPPRLPRSQG